jgi:integrase
VYCDDRKDVWSARNHADHIAFATAGGVKRKRASGTTIAGPLRSLLSAPLATIDAEAVNSWVGREVKERPTRARLGFRLFRAFINWCGEHDEYKAVANLDACRGKRTRERLGRGEAKNDALQREQLSAWFDAVRRDPNPVASSYLQALLLTGARREELAGLRWEDVEFDWGGRLNIPDKVQGRRTIPLTPYVAHLLHWLPRRPGNPYVFTSATSASGRLCDARSNHVRALEAAGLPHVTLHGLRRSFGTLAEWVEVPIGVVAQIQGHKPSAIAEKHYRVRPIDMLRDWHHKIEAWVLQTAGVDFVPAPSASTPRLQVVAA